MIQVVTYSLGRINRYISIRFRITLRSSKGVDSLQKSIFNGSEYLLLSGLYPSLIIDISDEIRGEKKIWNANKTVSFGKFTTYQFVSRASTLIQKMKEVKNLYVYIDGKLTIDKELAWGMRMPVNADFQKKIMMIPIVVIDPETNQAYEGISFMINEMSNYATMTYEEFCYFVDQIRKLNFDLLGIALVKLSLAASKSNDIPETKRDPIPQEQKEDVDMIKWNFTGPSNEIPKI